MEAFMKSLRLTVVFFVLVFLWYSAIGYASAGELKSIKPLPISPEGALTPELRSRIQESLPVDNHTRACTNAVTNNRIGTLVVNRELVTHHNNLYSNKIDTGKMTNQKVSGRCWLFASLNMMRQPMLKKLNVDSFEFSENYLMFWDKLEKANFFLEAIIASSGFDLKDKRVVQLLKEPWEDGGQWNFTVALVKKYGLVPKQAMEETFHSSETAGMDRIVSTLLRKDASILRKMHKEGKNEKDLRKKKETMLTEVYRILTYCLGTPPVQFEFRYEDKTKKASTPKIYTPLEFYQKEVATAFDDFVCFYSCPAWPYNRLYQIDLDRDIVEKPNMTFINVDIEELKAMALKSLLGGDPVWFGCDSGKDMDRETGIMSRHIFDFDSLFGIDFSMTKEERILYHETAPTHAMVFLGVDILNGKPRKWLVENSWGKDRGNDGYFAAYDDWFNEFIYQAIINKKYIPAATLDLLKTEPTVLPEDDQMRAFFFSR
jgi:bleomycin hydrolase